MPLAVCLALRYADVNTGRLVYLAAARTPRRWEQSLGRLLGVTVRLAGVEYPRPQTIRFNGLVLVDPETDAELGSCPCLEAAGVPVAAAMGWKSAAAPGLLLIGQQIELNADGWASLSRALADGFFATRLDARTRVCGWCAMSSTGTSMLRATAWPMYKAFSKQALGGRCASAISP